jgi:hypothetical protein
MMSFNSVNMVVSARSSKCSFFKVTAKIQFFVLEVCVQPVLNEYNEMCSTSHLP